MSRHDHVHNAEPAAERDNPRPRFAGPVPDEALVSGAIVLPGGLPPEDNAADAPSVYGESDDDEIGRPVGAVRAVPSRGALDAVATRLDRHGWGEDRARAWEYLDGCRELADERDDAAARGDRVTVAVADADRALLDEAYQDYVVPRAAAQTHARLEQEPPLSAEGQARIEAWARESAMPSPARGTVHDPGGDDTRRDGRGDLPAITLRYAHALLGLDHRDSDSDSDRDADRDSGRGAAAGSAVVPEPRAGDGSGWWPVPDPTLPAAELTDRELVACAEFFDEVTRGGSAANAAAATADLEAARAEAERRAALAGPDSVPAQVAGYLGLVREDTERALAAEAGRWRAELDGLLPPAAVVDAAPDNPHWERGHDAAHWSPELTADHDQQAGHDARTEGVQPAPRDRGAPDTTVTGPDDDEGGAGTVAAAREGTPGTPGPPRLDEVRATLAAHTLRHGADDQDADQVERGRAAQLTAWHADDHDPARDIQITHDRDAAADPARDVAGDKVGQGDR